jgi:hypothetical protein
MTTTTAQITVTGYNPALLDILRAPLKDLQRSTSTALDHALTRALDDAENPVDRVSAFSSVILDEAIRKVTTDAETADVTKISAFNSVI